MLKPGLRPLSAVERLVAVSGFPLLMTLGIGLAIAAIGRGINPNLVPLAILGAGLPIFSLVYLFSAIHGVYQHSNLPVRLGPLNWVFSLTELHRWHHSRRMNEANHNYGGNLAVWDVVFGTRYLPDDREPPEDIGIDSLPNFPMGFWANVAAPFRWRKLVADAREEPGLDWEGSEPAPSTQS